MQTTTTSGTFNVKLATARVFGLITSTQGKLELTNLGFAIVDPMKTNSGLRGPKHF
jgi:hypothetical protein